MEQTNVEVIRKFDEDEICFFDRLSPLASTQTISDSYDDDEAPTQPMKIWNGNSNNISRKRFSLSLFSSDLFYFVFLFQDSVVQIIKVDFFFSSLFLFFNFD